MIKFVIASKAKRYLGLQSGRFLPSLALIAPQASSSKVKVRHRERSEAITKGYFVS